MYKYTPLEVEVFASCTFVVVQYQCRWWIEIPWKVSMCANVYAIHSMKTTNWHSRTRYELSNDDVWKWVFSRVSFRQYWMGFFSTCFPPSVQYPTERWRHHNINFKSTAKSAVLFVCSTIRLLNDKHSVMVSWLLMQIPVQFERSTRWGIQLMVSVMQTSKMKKKMKTTVIIAFISIKQYANVPSHGIQQSAKKHAVLKHEALGVCVVFSLSSWSDFTSCWYITFHFHFDIHRIMCTKKIYAHRITMRLFIVRKHHQIKSNNLKSHLCGNLLQTLFLLFFRSAFYDSKFYGQHCMHMKKVPRMIKKIVTTSRRFTA